MWICLAAVFYFTNPTSAIFINTKSVSMRNARWLSENRLNWYHSYAPDVVKLLMAGTSDEDDDQKPGYDPGDVPTMEQINSRLRQLCAKANSTFMMMNLSRECTLDLRFLVCSGTELTNGLVALASKQCQKLQSLAQIQACQAQVNRHISTNKWTSECKCGVSLLSR